MYNQLFHPEFDIPANVFRSVLRSVGTDDVAALIRHPNAPDDVIRSLVNSTDTRIRRHAINALAGTDDLADRFLSEVFAEMSADDLNSWVFSDDIWGSARTRILQAAIPNSRSLDTISKALNSGGRVDDDIFRTAVARISELVTIKYRRGQGNQKNIKTAEMRIRRARSSYQIGATVFRDRDEMPSFEFCAFVNSVYLSTRDLWSSMTSADLLAVLESSPEPYPDQGINRDFVAGVAAKIVAEGEIDEPGRLIAWLVGTGQVTPEAIDELAAAVDEELGTAPWNVGSSRFDSGNRLAQAKIGFRLRGEFLWNWRVLPQMRAAVDGASLNDPEMSEQAMTVFWDRFGSDRPADVVALFERAGVLDKAAASMPRKDFEQYLFTDSGLDLERLTGMYQARLDRRTRDVGFYPEMAELLDAVNLKKSVSGIDSDSERGRHLRDMISRRLGADENLWLAALNIYPSCHGSIDEWLTTAENLTRFDSR